MEYTSAGHVARPAKHNPGVWVIERADGTPVRAVTPGPYTRSRDLRLWLALADAALLGTPQPDPLYELRKTAQGDWWVREWSSGRRCGPLFRDSLNACVHKTFIEMGECSPDDSDAVVTVKPSGAAVWARPTTGQVAA